VGIAPSPEGIAAFATAYKLASQAAHTLPLGTQQVVSVTERLPEVLLGASPEVTSLLVDQTLGGVLTQPGHSLQDPRDKQLFSLALMASPHTATEAATG